MSKKIELRVQSQGEKCKPVILKTVAKVQGVKSMSLDSDKGVLIITGCVDVVEVVRQLRKAKRPAEVVSVGPEKPPEKPGEKKDDKKDDKKGGDKKNGDKKDGDKKDGDKKDGGKKDEKKPECNCNKPLPCYCYYPQPSNYMPQPAGCPQVVVYDQPPHNNCTIC
ncbi:hypothetical protein FCM35_KLT09160 [Carex littledalei]|uniref:HMA domain-containing protein n=1 Tax=Carex littledalei TaxID=544730 RepID=A0A833QGF0_9POAL|nr:hypothetical protein FCM35_KLT09160 [Carex littledalei]